MLCQRKQYYFYYYYYRLQVIMWIFIPPPTNNIIPFRITWFLYLTLVMTIRTVRFDINLMVFVFGWVNMVQWWQRYVDFDVGLDGEIHTTNRNKPVEPDTFLPKELFQGQQWFPAIPSQIYLFLYLKQEPNRRILQGVPTFCDK